MVTNVKLKKYIDGIELYIDLIKEELSSEELVKNSVCNNEVQSASLITPVAPKTLTLIDKYTVLDISVNNTLLRLPTIPTVGVLFDPYHSTEHAKSKLFNAGDLRKVFRSKDESKHMGRLTDFFLRFSKRREFDVFIMVHDGVVNNDYVNKLVSKLSKYDLKLVCIPNGTIEEKEYVKQLISGCPETFEPFAAKQFYFEESPEVHLRTIIKEERKRHKMSQQHLGSLLSITKSYISLVETGRSLISVKTAKKFCEIFDFSHEKTSIFLSTLKREKTERKK